MNNLFLCSFLNFLECAFFPPPYPRAKPPLGTEGAPIRMDFNKNFSILFGLLGNQLMKK